MSEKFDENLQKELYRRFKHNNVVLNVMDALNKSDEETWNSLNIAERCGPILWGFLHYMGAVADKENNQDLYYKALNILAEGHPCEECRSHIIDNLRKINPNKYTSCLDHSIDFHNLVNKMLKKINFDKEKAKQIYTLECSSCKLNY